MADTMGTPVKAFKKKKPLAFLKSAPKPTPSLGLNKDRFDTEAEDDDDGLDLFRRSKDFFPIVVREQEGREETPPREKSAEHKHFSNHCTQSTSPPSSKRRKLSSPLPACHLDTEADLYGPPTPPRRVRKSPSRSPLRSRNSPSTPSPAKGRGQETLHLVPSHTLPTPARSNSNQSCADEVIILDDDDDEDDDDGAVDGAVKEPLIERPAVSIETSMRISQEPTRPPKEETPSPGPFTIDDSDDDVLPNDPEPAGDDPFAHFVQQAREREAAAKAAAAAATATARPEVQPSTPEGATPKTQEPVIEVGIYVHSRISKYTGLKPFGARRGISQNLGVIRRAFLSWLRSMGCKVSKEDESSIFLTWKRRKIYDVSTGVSLGWNPSATGTFSTSRSTPGFMSGGVLLEAWTQEDFDEWLAEEEKQRMMKRGDLIEEVSDDEAAEEQVNDPTIRVSIKEKDQEPFKVTVYTDMQIRLLVAAIRRMKKVPDDREVKLRYEGEWLDGNITIDEADIEDYCTVEMYLR